jgi:hypothetical protein
MSTDTTDGSLDIAARRDRSPGMRGRWFGRKAEGGVEDRSMLMPVGRSMPEVVI